MDDAVDMLKRRCHHQLSCNVSLYSDDDRTVSDVVHLIQQQLCFDHCQPHGHCQHGNYTITSTPSSSSSSIRL